MQPHSLEGIQIGSKMNKEKKKSNNQDVDNNQKSESNENAKTHTKDQQKSSTSKNRRRSNEILPIVTPATSYAQVIIIIFLIYIYSNFDDLINVFSYIILIYYITYF